MKIRIVFLIILTSVVALACGLFAACSGETHNHDFKLITAETEPTCTEDGLGLYRCDCGEEKEQKIPALDHDWGEWERIFPTTCEDAGVMVRICKNDISHIDHDIIPPFGHDWKIKDSQQPTCTEDGYESLVCRTDSSHTQERILSATGHSYGEWHTVIEPGCFTVGSEECSCEYCGDAQARIINETGHEYKNGVCTVCGRKNWDILDAMDVDLYSSDYCYAHLSLEENSLNMQALYNLIDGDARNYHNGVENSEILGTYNYAELGLTFEDAVTVWKAFMDDHPLYYWLGRTVEYGATFTVPVDRAYANPDIRAEYNQIIYNTADAWRSTVEETAYLSALSYHDKIIYAIDYAYLADGRTPQTASWAHNIIGVFTGQGAVCEGYARAFQLMLNMTGISNVFVTGTSNGSAHAWNLVKLDDGQWYWFDLTNDDVPGWLWGVKYNYFAVNDTQNINWWDSDAVYGNLVTFPSVHTPDSGTGVQYMPTLPERSQSEYQGRGELLLRQTFTVNGFTYAVVGYNAVQLIKCTKTGEIFIPECVEYGGTLYEVISMGSMLENGLFYYMDNCLFSGSLTTLHIPKTVRYMFETGRPSAGDSDYGRACVQAYEVDENNQYFTAVDGVLFTKNMYTLVAYPGNSPRTEYYIPDNVVYIAVHAFPYRCSNLRSLTIGSGLSSAGSTNWGYGWLQDEYSGSHNFISGSWASMFSYLSGCLEEIKVSEDNPYFSAENGMLFNKDKTALIAVLVNLTEVVVPSTVTVVKYNSFFYSYRLTRLVFEGDALQTIENAFGDNSLLKEIVFGGTREQWDAVKKEGYNGRAWDEWLGRNTPNGTYTLRCIGDL